MTVLYLHGFVSSPKSTKVLFFTQMLQQRGVGGNIARFVNHSCRPNCYIDIKKGVIWIRAARTIRRGEELTYDYNTEGDKTIPCRCRPNCKTRL